MTNDLYFRAVFTVIAIALSMIAWDMTFDEAAHAQFSSDCGSSGNPCFVKAADIDGLSVSVENWP